MPSKQTSSRGDGRPRSLVPEFLPRRYGDTRDALETNQLAWGRPPSFACSGILTTEARRDALETNQLAWGRPPSAVRPRAARLTLDIIFKKEPSSHPLKLAVILSGGTRVACDACRGVEGPHVLSRPMLHLGILPAHLPVLAPKERTRNWATRAFLRWLHVSVVSSAAYLPLPASHRAL
jgi:hypothetical protein